MDLILISIIIIVIIVILVWLYNNYGNRDIEHFESKKFYYRCKPLASNPIVSEILKKLDYELCKDASCRRESTLYLPCGYAHTSTQLEKTPAKNQLVFAIPDAYNLSSKYRLWQTLKDSLGREGALEFVPNTYNLLDSGDVNLLRNNIDPDVVYIAKNHKQAKMGLELLRGKEAITNLLNNRGDNQVIQEVLYNTLLVNGYKTGLRLYLFMIRKNGRYEYYLHRNGKVLYTKKPHINMSLDGDRVFNTGDVPDSMYNDKPFNMKELEMYCNENGLSYRELWSKITTKLTNILRILGKTIKEGDNSNTYFELFGVDIFIHNNLDIKLIEMNRGPNMRVRHPRDRELKEEIYYDLFSMMGILSEISNKPNIDRLDV